MGAVRRRAARRRSAVVEERHRCEAREPHPIRRRFGLLPGGAGRENSAGPIVARGRTGGAAFLERSPPSADAATAGRVTDGGATRRRGRSAGHREEGGLGVAPPPALAPPYAGRSSSTRREIRSRFGPSPSCPPRGLP